jgi:SOS regulatory protein LexA
VETPGVGLASLPLVGIVAAGAPIEAVEDHETIEVPRDLVPKRGKSFVLRVQGESMIDEQIRDGDFVVVEGRSEARDGETVVALVRGGDATLKTFFRKGSKVRLVPANSRMKPLEVSAREVEIRGVVRGLLRRY